ncbi:MAG: hypothetical protein SP1CHLAM54_03660 [Chlamydiia bacterium]|nr:hypothetical protein [Chlamydiia bacterium]MCH9615282.1 hypothetical protein [Chlamydiia bacterium]MCH9628396.1 hypothetical protein [Chlamydiia bacterium]
MFTGIVVWGVCALFFLYEFLLRTVIGTFQHPIMQDLNLNSFKFTLISSSTYLLVYGLMQIPVGLITDRYGLKKSLFLGAFVCSLSVLGFSYANTFVSAMCFRVLTGFGSSFGFVCLLVAVYEWMPKKHLALLIGVSQFIGTMGPMIAAGPINALAHGSSVSWRSVFLVLGGIGFLISTLILLFVKNSPKQRGSYVVLKKRGETQANLLQLIKRVQPWSIAFFSATVYFSIEFLSENDGKHFLMLKGHSSHFASYMLTLAWFGYAIGCPLLGFLSDLTNRRKHVMLFAALLGLSAILTIIFAEEKFLLVGAFLGLGLATSGQSVGFALISEQFKTTYLAVGLALNNAVIMTFSAISAPAIGSVIDSMKTTTHPTMANYQHAFYALIGIAFVALILILFAIKETFCKSAVDFNILHVRRHSQ